MSEIPFYLKKYDPDILKRLIVGNVNYDKGTFDYEIEYYDPTDDNPKHKRDENGLVLKKGTGKGTFAWTPGLPESEAENEEDLYPTIDWIDFKGLAVSDEIWLYVHDNLYSILESIEEPERTERDK